MKGISYRFFITAAVLLMLGMIWGIVMSASEDHSLASAHGHLNLFGFVVMSVFGIYYALTPQATGNPANIHYWLSLLAVVTLVPGIVLAINEVTPGLAILGSFLALASMVFFVWTVARNGVGQAT